MVVGVLANVELGKVLPTVSISGDDGGYFRGVAWDSSMLKGKTTMLMYVDPDEKGKGEVFKPTIEKLEVDMDFDKFQIVVVLNLNASWKPNFVIKKLSESKLTDYPKRIYVFDNSSILVKKWGVKDNEYNTIVIDSDMKPIYSHSGAWSSKDMKKIDSLIRSSIR